MKKREFKKKLNFSKVAVIDLSNIAGGRAEGTHYEWCEKGWTEFPCNLENE
ncbi:hypothetical protein [Kordia zhangzhouensis]|uniref:hypothetical protein n=1 Tax=Kordia zhangzhouensis TaxID=1620405 RepID=UPI0012E053AF|nr:hypothetical protein [Kordia zhangzhouensis]